MLPENHVRKDTKMYEEVYIPITINLVQPLTFKDDLISISSLDQVFLFSIVSSNHSSSDYLFDLIFQIGQTVFSVIETLNRIQSIVFNTAYHTNENLLICAPTGAGKTNVALLTIVHEIKQNIENGIIKKDQFKVSQ